ncbi:MAG TPA: hypothetical protein PKL84_05580, partial [Candidatus Hydrogenedentes bacterium]|nr:hypothetical protein [Candidatus Hydrogenedentota bacterium]
PSHGRKCPVPYYASCVVRVVTATGASGIAVLDAHLTVPAAMSTIEAVFVVQASACPEDGLKAGLRTGASGGTML